MKTTAVGQSRVGVFRPRARVFVAVVLSLVAVLLVLGHPSTGRTELPLPIPPSLKTIPVPEPPNLMDFVQDRQTAIVLGKALFWDMQVGSDGVQACATCHFHAGADSRIKNQINPGLAGGDSTFETGGPNHTLTPADFPFHQRQDPVDQQESAVVRNFDDVISSQGVTLTQFVDIGPGAVDLTIPLDDPIFNVGGVETRRVAGRNAPSVINAVFNFANFWDGRANNVFNGVNPFGPADANARIFENVGTLQATPVRISNASLASQATGPPLNAFEMSGVGRSFPKIGKKMLRLQPLAQQLVHPNDSVLGLLSMQRTAAGTPGLATTYDALIRAAFRPKYWENTTQIVIFQDGVPSILPNPSRALQTDEFTQMEANFSLFFGLAIQLYESTLVADDTLFDQVQEGRAAFSAKQLEGFNLFQDQGRCSACHVGPEFTGATVTAALLGNGVPILVEAMVLANGQEAIYDTGYYNIAVRPTASDLGRGAFDPFGFPLSFAHLGKLKAQGALPAELAAFVLDLPPGVRNNLRVASDGSFKTPNLRNVELTGPYFHNGSVATLSQVVEFYVRGGNVPQANLANLDPIIGEIGHLQGHPERQAALVAFLLTLTDERVRDEAAPFDHPQLIVPNGVDDANPFIELFLTIPAVGADGRAAQGLPPIQPVLAPNRAPLANNDTAVVPQNSVNAIDVLANDGDPDGDPLAVVAVTQGSSGTVAVGPGGAGVVYTPNLGFTGIDSFTYTIDDGSLTATATIVLLVQAANGPPAAVDDTATIPFNATSSAIDVLANDGDLQGNPITVVAVTQGLSGTVIIGPGGANVSYAPFPGFAGVDAFTYTISDGAQTATARVGVTVNRSPVAVDDFATVEMHSVANRIRVLANDVDPDGDELTILVIGVAANGSAAIGPNDDEVIYTPHPNFTGTDRLSYAITDGHLITFATIQISVVRPTRLYLPLVIR